MSEPSILDARLAEIDRRLRTIQSGLAPVPDDDVGEERVEPPESARGRDPEPLRLVDPGPGNAATADEPSAADAAPAAEAVRAAADAARAAEAVRAAEAEQAAQAGRFAELVEAHERLLELHRELLSQYAEVLERRAAEGASLAVAAGPFVSAGAVREFERALAALPGVSAVTVREYLGEDRVQVDVQLAPSPAGR
ncbi:MAG TPA: hypothetical protein VKV21_09235 [Solirubrobacteraceae bacterium]|nr:hypothetical protein [Solirubrobacteraceae bacterium]